ncbi:MAG: hypothetical protein NTW87_12400 [Planctomycetota bacterium]|nr:hypothetical protein [Planctomycetota bacterium]
MARRKKARRRAPKRQQVPAPQAGPQLPPAAESPLPASPSSDTRSGDELKELEAQLRRDELEDAPPAPVPAAVTAADVQFSDAVHGAAAHPEAIDLPPADFMRNMAKTVFAIAALRYGPHWELSEREAGMIGEASAPLGARMLSHVEGIWVELGVVAVVLFPIVEPRIRKEAELARARAGAPAA